MKKILLLTEIFPPAHGGSGRWLSEIYGRLPEGAVTALVGEQERSECYDRMYPHTVHRFSLSSRAWGVRSREGLAFYFRIWKRLANLVREEAITEVHCGRVLPEGVPALLLKLFRGVPYTCYVHGEDVEVALTSRELTWLTRQVMRHAKLIVCNSENSRRILMEKWQLPDARLVVMTPGVDIERFSPEPDQPRPEQWRGRTVVLTVGRLQKRKGQDMMIRALPAVLEQFPDLLYSIVGGGEERPDLEALAVELGVRDHVEFAGEINDQEMVTFYQHCDLFALPNRRVGNDDEGFGMVLLEAQACGTAVLAGDSGGTCETMNPGETGLIADCTSPEPLAKAVCGLLADREQLEVMGKAGRRHAVGRFGWDALAEKAKEVFQLDS